MDFQRKLQEFLSTYQVTGWILLFMAAGVTLQALVYVMLSLFGSGELYPTVLGHLSLPASAKAFIFKPWTILTYPFVNVSTGFYHTTEGNYHLAAFPLLRVLFDGLILWYICRLHQQFLNENRTRRLMIMGIPLIGLLTVAIGSLLFKNTEGHILFLSGLRPAVIMLLVSVTTLVPNYPIPLFLFGRVRLVYVTVALTLLSSFSGFFFAAPLGLAVLLGALLGFLHVYLLKSGTDITETVWEFYQEKPQRPKMKVSHRAYTTQRENEESPSPEQAAGIITQEQIDLILDKISDKGYESLSRREKEILFRASSEQEDEKS